MISYNEWKINKIAHNSNLNIKDFDPKQIEMGMEEELEHGKKDKKLNITNNDPSKTLKIVLAHLKEDPKYYSKLKKCV